MPTSADTSILLDRITVSSKVMLGKPTIRGTRLTVEHVLKAMVAGLTFEQLHDDFPFLEPADLQACLLYAAQLVEQERVFAIAS